MRPANQPRLSVWYSRTYDFRRKRLASRDLHKKAARLVKAQRRTGNCVVYLATCKFGNTGTVTVLANCAAETMAKPDQLTLKTRSARKLAKDW